MIPRHTEPSHLTPHDPERARITVDPATGLPLIQCRHPAAADDELTPEMVADILMEQEAAWSYDAGE